MIPIAKPEMTKEDAKAVARVVMSGWILQGTKVAKFEKTLGEYIKSPYAIATSSCTTAMHLGLLAAGIKPGDEVIVPSFTFIASPNCIVHAGATPVFADIDPQTYNIDPVDIERKITKKTRAILAVHQIGLPANMDTIVRIAKKHHILVFEDAAPGLGATIHGRHVGTFGLWGAFSFHPRKTITTAEGGLLTTASKKIADTVSMLRAHGANVSVAARHKSKKILFEHYPLIGYNFRMSDIHAALGISQFSRFEHILRTRMKIAKRYDTAFGEIPNIKIPFVPPGYRHTYTAYVLRLVNGKAIRNRIMQKLLDVGIATRAGVMASHLEAPYKAMYPTLRLPETERAAEETIALPIYPQLTVQDQTYVIDQVTKAIAQYF
jgi:perosamine synthetase